MFYFMNNQLCWVDTLTKKGQKQDYPCGPQPVRPLILKSDSPLLCWFFCVVAQAHHDIKTSTVLVYMILNSKGWSIQLSWLFINNISFILISIVSVYHS